MDVSELLKNLRDALWQASIELKRPRGEQHPDSYEIPPVEVAEDLAAHGVLEDSECRLIVDFLTRFDPESGANRVIEPDDEMASGIVRITAELRSVRGQRDRDLGGFGKR